MPNNVIELVVKVTDQATAQLRGISARIGPILGRAAVAGSLLFGVALRAIIKATKESQAATAQLDAAYRATGAGLGRTREQLDALATQMQRTTVYEDDLVKGAQAILLTFDKVRGDAFERTIKVSADLAARLGTDLTSAVRTLGIALQDPEQGMVRLRRAGVLFTEAQQKTIKGFTDLGQTAKAQAFILGEVERRFSGAAAAARNTLGGALAALHNAFGDLLEQSERGTEGLVAAINSITETLSDPATKRAVVDFFTLFIELGEKAVQTIVGLGSIFNIVGDESERITRRIEGLRGDLSLSKSPSNRKAIQDEIDLLEKRQRLLLGLDPTKAQVLGRGGGSGVLAKADIDTSGVQRALEEVAVTARRIEDTATQALVRGIDEGTRTAIGKATAQWEEFAVNIQELLARGLDPAEASRRLVEGFDAAFGDLRISTQRELDIFKTQLETLEREAGLSAEQAAKIYKEVLDKNLPEIEVKVKKIDPRPFQQITEEARRAAESIQDAFANAFRSIFEGDSLRNIAANFLRAIAEIPVQIAAERLGAKIRAAIEPSISKALGGASSAAQAAQKAAETSAPVVAAVTAGATQTTAAIAEQVNATVSASQSLCECICSCLGALKDAVTGGPGVVAGAIGAASDTSKTTAKAGSKDVVEGIDRSVKASTQVVSNAVINGSNAVVSAIFSTAKAASDQGLFEQIIGTVIGIFSKTGAKAGGGMASGRTLVGEEGPEVVDLPAGSRVTNQRQAAFGGGAKLNFAPAYNITISGGDNPKAAQQALLGYLQLQDGKQKKWVLDLMRTNFGRVVTP